MYNFLDVGSRYSIDSCFPPPIKHNAPKFKILFDFYGIEPETTEYNRLKKLGSFKEIHNVGLYSSTGNHTLYITKGKGKASILKPDIKVIQEHFSGDIKEYGVVETQEIVTTTIDSLFPDTKFDIIKVDVQGVEYEVFKGGEKHLANATSLWAETSTVAQYEGQKTHDEIVSYLDFFGFDVIYRNHHTVIPVESDVIFLNREGDPALVEKFKKWFNIN